ncbi:FlaG/FlaF family flagellin (archaellin) [Methanomicrobium sp. W14]|uniref:type IV pilin N-terminal domain-containing protein n=1 Tax=Methanomicrobium sp. W14 TaxID=2817839 RepID=UPI001FD8B200|nr:type IV pilin N-terminal domain-containing protein [Methanomicrobium sp. W14]MBP2134401.1 FlaG/FlaF family flagellin (archaellin) [Methanomicrobium sp. W14]
MKKNVSAYNIGIKSKFENDSAVSPVVGVMLMLVVTIIIAAAVSGFAGSLLDTTEKAPSLTMDVKIVNNGYWPGTYFTATVTGVDSAIPSSDLKITTEWSATDYTDGEPVSGGATVIPGVTNTRVHYSPWSNDNNEDNYSYVSPLGYGTGVGMEGDHTTGGGHHDGTLNDFGNYSLTTGTTLWAQPFGKSSSPVSGGYEGFDVGYGPQSQWQYSYGTSTCVYYSHLSSRYSNQSSGLQHRTDAQFYSDKQTDQMQAVLGKGWENLRAGDVVTVTVVHTPSGKTIWQKDVTVEA